MPPFCYTSLAVYDMESTHSILTGKVTRPFEYWDQMLHVVFLSYRPKGYIEIENAAARRG
jgi:hypothetical protein